MNDSYSIGSNTKEHAEFIKERYPNGIIQQEWFTYIVQCSDNSLYTGVTTDLERRVKEHNTSNKGAKYTKTRRPVKLVYNETHTDRSSSCKRESAIKKLSRIDKLKIINERRI